MPILQMEGNKQDRSLHLMLILVQHDFLFTERQEVAKKDLLPHEGRLQSQE